MSRLVATSFHQAHALSQKVKTTDGVTTHRETKRQYMRVLPLEILDHQISLLWKELHILLNAPMRGELTVGEAYHLL